jgi:hypothetical protein
MEAVVARRYQGTDGYDQLGTMAGTEAAVSGFSKYSRTTSVETVAVNYATGAITVSGSDVGYKRVRVSVAWDGGSEQIVVEHLFSNFQL